MCVRACGWVSVNVCMCACVRMRMHACVPHRLPFARNGARVSTPLSLVFLPAGLQSLLSADQMRFAYVRALVDVTNRVGVDVRAIRHVAPGLAIGSIATRHIALGLTRRR